MLDLAPPGREEALQPDFTPNPILEVLIHEMVHGSLLETSFTTLILSSFLNETKFRILYIFQRFFHCLELKSKDPDAVVPPLDETLKKIAEPDPILLSQNKSVISAFRGSFEFKENPKVSC